MTPSIYQPIKAEVTINNKTIPCNIIAIYNSRVTKGEIKIVTHPMSRRVIKAKTLNRTQVKESIKMSFIDWIRYIQITNQPGLVNNMKLINKTVK